MNEFHESLAICYYSGRRCQALVTAPFRQADGTYNLIVFELFAKSAWHLSSNRDLS